MNKKLIANNLNKSYGSRNIVKDVSLQISAGEIVGLLGPNGAGKTTSFYMCVGLVKADAGQILLEDLDITSMPMFKRAQLGIGYLPQEASIFRKLSVENNILAILENIPFNSNQDRMQKLEDLINELGLNQVRKSLASALSGGERRRVEIARALASSPSFLLLDEPFAGIDPIAVSDIQKIITQLKNKNIGILITDHNVRETLGICDRSYILAEGKILVDGTPEVIINSELAKKYYLGNMYS